jgi:hypothetical protein
MTPFSPLGMTATGDNDSQSFWGLDLEILLLCMPLLTVLEVAMVQPVCIMHAVCPKNAQGGDLINLDWKGKLKIECGPGFKT